MTPQELHAAVWRVRAEVGHVWLTPPPLDCLRYAFTEVGEAMDAWLRAQRPDDARNNERSPDVLDELGDCAIMLCSALSEGYTIITPDRPRPRPATLDDVAIKTAEALDAGGLMYRAELALHYIYSYPGFTTTVALLRLDRIRVKHATEREFVPDKNLFGYRRTLINYGYFNIRHEHDGGTYILTGWREALALYARREWELSR